VVGGEPAQVAVAVERARVAGAPMIFAGRQPAREIPAFIAAPTVGVPRVAGRTHRSRSTPTCGRASDCGNQPADAHAGARRYDAVLVSPDADALRRAGPDHRRPAARASLAAAGRSWPARVTAGRRIWPGRPARYALLWRLPPRRAHRRWRATMRVLVTESRVSRRQLARFLSGLGHQVRGSCGRPACEGGPLCRTGRAGRGDLTEPARS